MIIRKDKSGLDARLTPSDLDIAWASGVYEGEGSCSRSGHGKRSFVVSISQKDPEVLYRLRGLFGGSVNEFPNNRGTKFTNNEAFTIYAWRVCGDRGRLFLAVIYSYLTTRRKSQVDATPARAFLDLVGAVPREGAFSFVTSKLNEHISSQLALRSRNRKTYLRNFHETSKLNDPQYMEKRRQRMRAWRAKNKQDNVVAIA